MERVASRWIRWLPLGYLAFGMAWVLLSDYVLARVFTGDEAQLLFGSSLKGVVFIVLTTAMIHLALVFGLPASDAAASPARATDWLRGARGPIIAVLLSLALISACAYMVVDRQIERIRIESGSEIENAAALRASNVEAWYLGHRAALEGVQQSPFAGPAVRQWLTQPSEELAGKIERRLKDLRDSGNYVGVSLLDTSGRVLKTAGAYVAPDATMLDAITRATTERRMQTTDLRKRNGTGRLVMDMVAPLLDGDGPEAAVVALVVASDDAWQLLEGLGPQMLGDERLDAMLARREGESVELITVKPAQGQMPAVPVVLQTRRTSAAGQALAGARGVFEGTGDHGQPAIAIGVPAKGTPWLVVVTRDLSLITNQVLKLLTQAIALAVLSVSVVVTLVLLWWRAERRRTDLELQRTAERALELEARLGWASDFANDAILLMDADGCILDANERARTAYGYSREEFVEHHIRDLRQGDPASPGIIDQQLAGTLGNGSLIFEATHLRKDGTTFPVEVSARRVEHGGKTYVQSIVRDITERVRQSTMLHQTEQRYRALFDANPHPTWVLDYETSRFLIVNDAAVARYGYSRAEFGAMSIADIRPDEAVDGLHGYPNSNGTVGLREEGICKHRRKDGSLLDVEIVSHDVEFNGRPARLVLANDVTKPIEAERALRTSEERYRKLFEEVHDGIVQLHPDSRLLDANTEAAGMFGYQRDELLGLGLEELLDESEHARLASILRDVSEGAAPVPPKQRWLHRRRDGTRFVAEVGSRRLEDGTIIATIHDLTEILSAQRQIERQRDMFDLLSQCNQSAARVSSRDELFNDVVHLAVDKGHFSVAWIGEIRPGTGVWPVASAGDDRGQLADARRGLEAGAPMSNGALIRMLVDGRVEVVNDTAADPRDFVRMLAKGKLEVHAAAALPIRTGGKVTHGLILYAAEAGVFTTDIVRTLTDMSADVSFAIDVLNMRRELDESRNLFEAIIDASENPIFANDLEGRTLFLNKASALALGTQKSDALGRRLAEYLHEDLAAAYARGDAAVLLSGSPQVFEEQAHGQSAAYLTTRFPLRDINGRVYGIGGVSTDITALRHAQTLLADANASLEHKVAQRTRSLAAAKDRAEAADRAKSVFLSSVSHELRSPLHSIIGFNSVLIEGIDGALNAAQLEHLRIVQDSSLHLLSIINDLLDLAKIEAGAIAIEDKPFRPQDVMQRVADVFGIQAAAKTLELTNESRLVDLTINGDERRVEQIVANLVSNAIKYTFSGSVRIRTEVGNGQLFVDVEDTGIGISDADQRRLFRRFNQLDPGQGRLIEGTGLGLAIARGLADAMGGTLSVLSEVGKGSKFTLILPLAGSARDAA